MDIKLLPLESTVHPSWIPALQPVQKELAEIQSELQAIQLSGTQIAPPPPLILRAFSQPFSQVKVLIMGQDPYPTPGHAQGLSFSAAPAVQPLPRSLKNIFTELEADLGQPRQCPENGDLSAWFNQGVLLLNRVLTCEVGAAGSHRKLGWQKITDQAVRALVARKQPLVAVLWGRDAAQVKPLLNGVDLVESAHPSPLSARRGFFGSRPFSRVNALLMRQGAEPINWME